MNDRAWRADEAHGLQRRIAEIAPLEADCGAAQLQPDGRLFLGGYFSARQLRQLAEALEGITEVAHGKPLSGSARALS